MRDLDAMRNHQSLNSIASDEVEKGSGRKRKNVNETTKQT